MKKKIMANRTKQCKVFTEDCYNHPQCLETLKDEKIENWEEKFRLAWAEESDKLLDKCGFEKDNQKQPEIPSTTGRSKALVLQAYFYIFALSFIKNLLATEREKAYQEGRQESFSMAIPAELAKQVHDSAFEEGVKEGYERGRTKCLEQGGCVGEVEKERKRILEAILKLKPKWEEHEEAECFCFTEALEKWEKKITRLLQDNEGEKVGGISNKTNVKRIYN